MSEWEAPEVWQVAGYLPTRTKNDFSAVQRDDEGRRTFNETTEPTADEVAQQIGSAKTIIESDVGTTFCNVDDAATFPAKAAELTALYAAMLVELGFFPEQVQRNQSPYPQLKVLYDEKREQLRGEIDEVCGDVPGPDPGAESGPDVQMPQYGGFEVEFGSGQW